MRAMRAKSQDTFTERSIYGLIITATLLITLENHEDSSWDMILTILLTLLAVVVAERYASVFARGVKRDTESRWHDFSDMRNDYLYMLSGSAAPTLLFLLSGIGAITLLAAFNIAEFIIALLLILYGYAYGQKHGRSKLASTLYGLTNFSVVALIVLFKSVSHV